MLYYVWPVAAGFQPHGRVGAGLLLGRRQRPDTPSVQLQRIGQITHGRGAVGLEGGVTGGQAGQGVQARRCG